MLLTVEVMARKSRASLLAKTSQVRYACRIPAIRPLPRQTKKSSKSITRKLPSLLMMLRSLLAHRNNHRNQVQPL